MQRLRRWGRAARVRAMVGLVVATVIAAALALAPLVTGSGLGRDRGPDGLPAGSQIGQAVHHGDGVDLREDVARRARCAEPERRRANPSGCPAAADERGASGALGQARTVGRWSGELQVDGLPINATLLPTGKVLWFAFPEKPDWYPGPDAEVNWAEAWVFDPATGASVRRDPPIDPDTGRPFDIWCAGQTLLRDGRIVVAGGNHRFYSAAVPKFRGLDVVLTFNPFNEKWTYQGRTRDGRWYPTLTELPDGRVVIVAGLNRSGQGPGDANNPDVEVFAPSPDLDGVGTITREPTAERFFGLYPHLFVVPDGRLMLVGPNVHDTAFLDTTTWTWDDSPDLPARRDWGSATLLPSGPAGPKTVMLIGGSDTDSDMDNAPATDTTVLVDTATGAVTPGPPSIRARSHLNTTILPDGTLFTNGGGLGTFRGNRYAGPVYSGELHSPATGATIETPPQADERTYHSTSLLIPDGRVISMGDDRRLHSRDLSRRTLEYYSPPYLFRGSRPRIVSSPAAAPYAAPVGVGVGDPASIARVVLMKLGSRTHALDVDQRALELPVSQAAGGVTFTTPASAAVAPPGYYLLFAVDGRGVPSTGAFIRLDSSAPAPPAAPGPARPAFRRYPPPRLSGLDASASSRDGVATIRLRIRAPRPFAGLVTLSRGASAADETVTKGIAGGRSGRAAIRIRLPARRVQNLRLSIALRDPRAGPVRTIAKTLRVTREGPERVRVLVEAP
jgi:hypothetical protein